MTDDQPPWAGAGSSPQKKRFIAGAVCPACRVVDRLVVSQLDDTTQERTCVNCGFTDQVGPVQMGAVPRGKVERRASVDAASIQTVRVLDPRDGKPGNLTSDK